MSTASHLAREINLKGILLTAVGDALFGIYQDWVHQNLGTHLDLVIYKDCKWQTIWKNLFVSPPNNMMYHLAGLGLFCLDTRGGARRYTRSEMELWAGDSFSDSYFSTRPPRNWRQKYPRTNQYPTRLVQHQSIQ